MVEQSSLRTLSVIGWTWRCAAGALAVLAANMASGGILAAAGVPLPQVPGQVFDPAAAVAAVLLAACLVALAAGLQGSTGGRWLILGAFTFVALGVDNAIEAGVFTRIGGTFAVIALSLIPSLVAALPLLARWGGSRRSLVISLAAGLWVMVGLYGLIQINAWPLQMRAVHAVEILADSVVHAWALVALLVPRFRGTSPVATVG